MPIGDQHPDIGPVTPAQSTQTLSPAEFGMGSLFWQIPEAVIVADGTNGRIVLWNPAAETIFGFSSEQAVGCDVEMIIPMRHRSAHHAGMSRFAVSGHGAIIDAHKALELPAIRQDGEEIQVELSLSRVDGPHKGAYVLAVIRDITGRKLAEHALRQQAQLLDLAQDVILVRDLESGRITFWNAAAERMFGWSWSEALGQNVCELLHTELPALRADIEHDLVAKGNWQGEGVNYHRDGSPRHLELRWTLQPADGNSPAAVLEFMLDLSERKQSEESLRLAYHELMKLDHYKDEFLSVISHELRTPLNFIMGFASLMDDEIVGHLSPDQHDYLRKILNGADRMLYLVNDLLDFAKLQAGKFDMEPQPTPYLPLVEDVVATMTPLAEDKGLAISVAVNVPVMPRIDGPRVIQVLTNFLSNAIKFTPPKGHISVTARIEAGELLTEVTDTGVGIAADDLDKVFEKFLQLDMSPTRNAGGTGLGLAISKALVEAHSGTIGVHSTPGKGSTFWFRVPLSEDVT
jgi:two-component system sensor histidine kinase/response regulator